MKREQGFSLIELMMAAAIGGFVLVSMYTVQKSQQRFYINQKGICTIQQNLRGGLYCMEREIRMAGYDPRDSGNFGITDVRLDGTGNGTITFTLDDNLNRTSDKNDGNGKKDGRETFVYALYDYPTASPDGILDLGRKYGSKRQLLAENIDALGFAFAFDRANDGDNALDKDINGNVIWAIDTDGDNQLDVNLDTDNDGDIDAQDNPIGKPLTHSDNGGLADAMLSDIRAVRIWLLARGNRENPDSVTTVTHVVANQRITPNDGLPRRVLCSIVRCRNMGDQPNN